MKIIIRHKIPIQSSRQTVRHKLIAKNITLQNIKQRQNTINFVNQLDLPAGLREMLIIRGFTLDLLLNMQPIDLAETLGIDRDVAEIVIHVAKKHINALRKLQHNY
jgi:hypothetical protein